MSNNNNFVSGASGSDINFFNNLVHDQSPLTFKMCADIVINASIINNASYQPVKLDNGFVFDGNNKTITIKYDKEDHLRVNPFNGLFNIINGEVKNLHVKVLEKVILNDLCGWINTTHVSFTNSDQTIVFVKNSCTITNCVVHGDINGVGIGGCGGISGAGSGCSDVVTNIGNDTTYTTFNGYCHIKNCKVYGRIGLNRYQATGCGGIVGAYSFVGCKLLDNCIIDNCSSFGFIMDRSGGIVGEIPGSDPSLLSAGVFQVINCSSCGDIAVSFFDGFNSGGGIVGSRAAAAGPTIDNPTGSKCIIINCTSSGDIKSTLAGGIMGSNAGSFGGICIVINCSSSGQIGYIDEEDSSSSRGRCGGIVGSYSGASNFAGSGRCYIINCSSSGDIVGNSCGGITSDAFAQYSNNPSIAYVINSAVYGNIIGTNCGGISGPNSGNNSSITGSLSTFVVDNCMILSNKPLPDDISGRITGTNSNALVANSYFYVAFSDYHTELGGISSDIIEDKDDPNHPTKTIEGLKLFECNIRNGDYDGFHGVGVENISFDYNLNIKKPFLNKTNVHPLPLEQCNIITATQRQMAFQKESACYQDNKIFMEFSLQYTPIDVPVRMWIPNAQICNPSTTYTLFRRKPSCFAKVGNLTLVNGDTLAQVLIDLDLTPDFNMSNIWELTFSACNTCGRNDCNNCVDEHKYKYCVFKTC